MDFFGILEDPAARDKAAAPAKERIPKYCYHHIGRHIRRESAQSTVLGNERIRTEYEYGFAQRRLKVSSPGAANVLTYTRYPGSEGPATFVYLGSHGFPLIRAFLGTRMSLKRRHLQFWRLSWQNRAPNRDRAASTTRVRLSDNLLLPPSVDEPYAMRLCQSSDENQGPTFAHPRAFDRVDCGKPGQITSRTGGGGYFFLDLELSTLARVPCTDADERPVLENISHFVTAPARTRHPAAAPKQSVEASLRPAPPPMQIGRLFLGVMKVSWALLLPQDAF